MKFTNRLLNIIAVSTVVLTALLTVLLNWNYDNLMFVSITTIVMYFALKEFVAYNEEFEYQGMPLEETKNGIKIHFPNKVTYTESNKYLIGYNTLFHLQTPSKQFFAKSLLGSKYKFDIYEDLDESKYVISFDLTRAFPLVDKNDPDKVIWSSSTYNDRYFTKHRYLTWRKDSKPVIHLKYNCYDIPPRLGISGSIENNELDLFLALISINLIPEKNSTA
jgi:hypothetical protein